MTSNRTHIPLLRQHAMKMHTVSFDFNSPGEKRAFHQSAAEREKDSYWPGVFATQGPYHIIDMDTAQSSGADSIIEPHENDVLMGRGGKNNQHSGNEKLREFAREQCEQYTQSTKKGKSYISKDLVEKMRQLDPPARYGHY